MHYKGVRDGKKRNSEKEGKINISTFIFFYTTSRCIQSSKTQAPLKAEKSVTEIFVGKKKKWTNKGTDKQHVADSLLHSTACHTQICTKFHNPMSSSS